MVSVGRGLTASIDSLHAVEEAHQVLPNQVVRGDRDKRREAQEPYGNADDIEPDDRAMLHP